MFSKNAIKRRWWHFLRRDSTSFLKLFQTFIKWNNMANWISSDYMYYHTETIKLDTEQLSRIFLISLSCDHVNFLVITIFIHLIVHLHKQGS